MKVKIVVTFDDQELQKDENPDVAAYQEVLDDAFAGYDFRDTKVESVEVIA